MNLKYTTSRSPEFDDVFDRLAPHVQSGIAASGLSLQHYAYLYVDDATVRPKETFIGWLNDHFKLTTQDESTLDQKHPVAEVLALEEQGTPPRDGLVPEEALSTLGREAIKLTN